MDNLNMKGGWGFETLISYKLRSDQFYNLETFKKFIFEYDIGIRPSYNSYKCFWPYFWVNILGLQIGIGFIKIWSVK